MSIASIERDQSLPPLIADLKRQREVQVIIDELSPRIPPVLHPHLPGYLTDLDAVLASPSISAVLNSIEDTSQEIHPVREKILAQLPKQNGDLERQIAALRRDRTSAAKRPEPLPTALKPALGRFTRALLSVVLGLELPRPDLKALDRKIGQLDCQRIDCKDLPDQMTQMAKLNESLQRYEENLLSAIDLWAIDSLPHTLIHLALNPDRLIPIMQQNEKRLLKNPRPKDNIWYVTWVLADIRKRYGTSTLASNLPKKSIDWLLNLLPHIKAPSTILNLFAKTMDQFEDPLWSLLDEPLVNHDILTFVDETLLPTLGIPGYSVARTDFTRFNRWGFITTAQRIGIFPEDKPTPAPLPEITQVLSKSKKRDKPAPTTALTTPQEITLEAPNIIIRPYNTNCEVVIKSNGTCTLSVSGKDQQAAFSESTITSVFDLKPNDPRAKTILDNLQRFRRTFCGFSRSGDLDRLNRPVFYGRYRADYKIRFGNWVILFSLGKGQKGIPTYVITAFGDHNEVYGS